MKAPAVSLRILVYVLPFPCGPPGHHIATGVGEPEVTAGLEAVNIPCTR